MKKGYLVILLTFIVLGLCGCNKNQSGEQFKKEYELLNGQTNKNGKIHRIVKIDKDNPYKEVNPKIILDKINNRETFYLYIGDPLCPWCRSVIEKSIEIAKKNKIKEIFYIDIWDEEGNEIFRDKYEIKDGKAIKIVNGTKDYYNLIKLFDNILPEYNLTDENGNNINVLEKRIYAPSFIYIKNGNAIDLIEGISSKQNDSREKLTEAILEDEEKLFQSFFKNK